MAIAPDPLPTPPEAADTFTFWLSTEFDFISIFPLDSITTLLEINEFTVVLTSEIPAATPTEAIPAATPDTVKLTSLVLAAFIEISFASIFAPVSTNADVVPSLSVVPVLEPASLDVVNSENTESFFLSHNKPF